jgi:exodeoxyribonuclease VII small subunit
MSIEKTDNIDFEKSLAELEKLVEQMEQGELSLEQSLAHFEQGVRLTRSCQQALEQARLKVDELLSTNQDDASPASDEQ